MLIYKNLDSFFHKKVMKMLETLVSRNYIVDNKVNVDRLFIEEPYSFIPPSLGIFFLIINLTLNVANTHTYDDVAKKINAYSILDESQAKAVISALTREIALIEGPPGTGKTVVAFT
ncbi:unnamed protein product [Rhizophagus irregularis]|nr:unnamed protein product [Rhizophagus irregularis]